MDQAPDGPAAPGPAPAAVPAPRAPAAAPAPSAPPAAAPPAAAPLTAAPVPPPDGASWPCTACGTRNPLADGVCGTCGTAFLAQARGARPTLVLPLVGDVSTLTPVRLVALGLALLAGLLLAALAGGALLG